LTAAKTRAKIYPYFSGAILPKSRSTGTWGIVGRRKVSTALLETAWLPDWKGEGLLNINYKTLPFAWGAFFYSSLEAPFQMVSSSAFSFPMYL
jgi:hypothetical protein